MKERLKSDEEQLQSKIPFEGTLDPSLLTVIPTNGKNFYRVEAVKQKDSPHTIAAIAEQRLCMLM